MCSLLIVFQFLLTQFANQFLGSNQLLLSGFHVFQGHFALVHFIFSNQCNKWNHLGIGITHLLLHFAGIGEYFGTNTCCPYSGEYIHRKSRLLLTKVDKQKLRTVHSFLRIQFQLVQHIEYAVCTKRNTHSGDTCHTKDRSGCHNGRRL